MSDLQTEKEALELYEWMMDHGYSDYEARADAWPEALTPPGATE